MGISAAAALLLVAGLSSMVRGGGDSSDSSVQSGPSDASIPVVAPGASVPGNPGNPGNPVDTTASASGSRLMASEGPYGDPFAVPAGAVVGEAGDGGGESAQVPTTSEVPASTETSASSPAAQTVDTSDPSEVQSTPGEVPDSGDVPGTSGEGTGGGGVPSPNGGGAKQSPAPSAVAPQAPAASTDPVAVLRLVIPGRAPRTAALVTKGVLPSRANPLLAVLQADANRRQAVLMLAADLRPEGSARCAPSAERCRRLTMSVGQVQLLATTSAAGEPVRYRLRLVAVR